ncbi:MAG TPA: DNA-3-methyladenine glycosylase [Candidatus Acidoferrum sp.]|nr:DNA-3-methyladenine glycosylase [Candidatus Acidoferrum sp.]
MAPPTFAIRRIRRAELPSGTLELARYLIGKVVVRELPEGRLSGRIVEAEGYPPGDPAGHHFRGPTQRNRSLFLRHGHVYVFFNYGMHFMLNISSEREGIGGGVLIRALEPLEGIELMKKHRKTEKLLELTRGPGRLAAALRIDRSLDGLDLFAHGPLWLGVLKTSARANATSSSPHVREVASTVRIGITHAADKPFRFYERANPFVSGPKHLLGASKPTKKLVRK